MAERLKISGNFLIIFEDGNPSNEYLNYARSTVRPRYEEDDTVRFYVDNDIVGEGLNFFDCTTLIDDRTGLAFASVSDLKLFLSEQLGFFLGDQYLTPYEVKLGLGKIEGGSLVNKFGFNPDIDNGQEEIIASFGGTFNPVTDIMSTAQTYTITYNSTTDGLGTNGALSLLITNFNASFQEEIQIHTLSNTGSDTTSFTGLGINRAVVLSTGSEPYNVNDITIAATTDTTTQALIPTESSVTQQLIFHTEISKTLLLNHVSINLLKTSGGSIPKVMIRGYSWSRVTNTRYLFFKKEIDAAIINDLEPNFAQPFSFLGREVIYFTLETDQNNTSVNGRFGGYQVLTQ